MCHLIPSNSVEPSFVWHQVSIRIWQYHPVRGGAKQFVGKMLAQLKLNQGRARPVGAGNTLNGGENVVPASVESFFSQLRSRGNELALMHLPSLPAKSSNSLTQDKINAILGIRNLASDHAVFEYVPAYAACQDYR